MNKNELISFRPAFPGDKKYIQDTWIKTLRRNNGWFRLIDKDAYFSTYPLVIDQILKSERVTVRVACLKEDMDVILGYCVYSMLGPLHWVFVRKEWRGIGLMNDLLPSNPITCITHLTNDGKLIMNKKHWSFNPFL